MSNMKIAFATMLETQATLNDLMAGPEWRKATLENDYGFDYREAIFVEAGEAVAHTNYKWWANTQTDAQQYKMELIDIAHFLLSFAHVVQRSTIDGKPFYPETAALSAMVVGWHQAAFNYPDHDVTVCGPHKGSRAHLRRLIVLLETDPHNMAMQWKQLFSAFRASFAGYSIEDLLNDYLSKSLLNRFRTVNGAKKYGVALNKQELLMNPKKYLKVWDDGREDNEHLSDMIREMYTAGTLNCDALYEQIGLCYAMQMVEARQASQIV